MKTSTLATQVLIETITDVHIWFLVVGFLAGALAMTLGYFVVVSIIEAVRVRRRKQDEHIQALVGVVYPKREEEE